MSTATNWLSSGLAFLGTRSVDIVAVSNRVSNTFDTLGQAVSGIRILSDGSAQVSSQHHEIKVELHEGYRLTGLGQPVALYLSVEAARRTNEPPEGTPALDSLLAHALKALQRMLSADYVQWTQPGMLLNNADFVMATTQIQDVPVRPRRVETDRSATAEHRCQRLPSIEETNERLQKRLTQREALEATGAEPDQLRAIFAACDAAEAKEAGDDTSSGVEDIREETAPLRLAVWMMSFIIALFALPVAAALIVVNLVKGENLRLASQTAALTGTFVAFQAYGTTAQAMTVLQSIGN